MGVSSGSTLRYKTSLSQSGTTNVVRAIGRWSLAALMVNIMIGSGIFGLPSKVASLTGRQSPIAFLLAAVGIAVIAACFAEVASRFRESGGPISIQKSHSAAWWAFKQDGLTGCRDWHRRQRAPNLFSELSRRILAVPEGSRSEGDSHYASAGGAYSSQFPRR